MMRVCLKLLVLAILAPATAWAAPDNAFGLGSGKDGAYPGASPTPAPSASTQINDYTTLMSSVSAFGTVLTLSDATDFDGPTTLGGGNGDLIMLWQPAGLTPVDSGTAPDAASIISGGVGKRELARIIDKTGNQVTITATECFSSPCSATATGLANGFDAAKTMVIRIPEYTTVSIAGGVNFVPKQAWDRTQLMGGIVAFLATGTVTIATGGTINADGMGFAGGPAQATRDSDGSEGCGNKDYTNSDTDGARKGEGIGGDSDDNLANVSGRGQALNGGGGGDCRQTGGGGGGNAAAGGAGGTGPNSGTGSRGLGGFALPYEDVTFPFSLTERITMGGGGAGGHRTNVAAGSAGGRGGGAVWIRAGAISGSGTARISANGANGTQAAGDDGEGGGGAGGDIYIRAAGTINLCDTGDIQATGGDGADATAGTVGAGGGGAGGRVFLQSTTANCTDATGAGNVNVQGGSAGGSGSGTPVGGFDGTDEDYTVAIYCSTDDLTADCNPATQMCNPASGLCVQCVAGPAGESHCAANFSATPHCEGTTCVDCRASEGDNDCDPVLPECSGGACVFCIGDTGSNPSASESCTRFAGNDPPLTHCEEDNGSTKDGECVECLISSDCPNSKPVCTGGNLDTCAPCTLVGQCSGQTGPNGSPRPAVCLGGGCVECANNNDCDSADKPACDTVNHVCVPCDQVSNDDGCNGSEDVSAGKTRCHRSGNYGDAANVGKCVACTGGSQTAANGQCSAAGNTPSCSGTNTCTGCSNLSGDTGCSGHAGKPLCERDNNESKLNQCVECLDNTPCTTASTPICLNDVCTACQSAGGSAACESKLATAPFCDTVNGDCESCGSSDAKCNVDAANRPACQGDGSCKECSSGNTSLCDETEPVCNTGTGECGACSNPNNSECSGFTTSGKLVCERTGGPLIGQCVECGNSVDTDCTTAAKARCVNNLCEKCTLDTQCNNGAHPGLTHCETGDLNGVCVQCRSTNSSADCPANDPVCSSHVCVSCTDNAQCTRFNTGSATFECDQTNGAGDPGDCVGCTNDSQCEAVTPRCFNRSCVDCIDDNNCTSHADGGLAACQPQSFTEDPGACRQCSVNNTSACTGATPACNLFNGTCQLCTVANVNFGDGGVANSVGCTGNANGNECQGASTNVFCGCNTDANCGNETGNRATSGRICNTISKLCVNGCSRAPGRNNCPVTPFLQFCTSNDMTGTVTGVCTTDCNFDVDCVALMPTMPYCVAPDGDAGRGRCAGCRNDGDCTTALPVCQTMNKVCVECTATRLEACSSAGKGAICLPDETCGCNADSDCGGTTSGRICDLTGTHKCIAGCRQSGGNGCPANLVCSAAGLLPGMCVEPRDLAMPVFDLSVPDAAEPDMAVPIDLGPTVSLSGGGLGDCSFGGAASASQSLGAMLLLLGLAGVVRRRRK